MVVEVVGVMVITKSEPVKDSPGLMIRKVSTTTQRSCLVRKQSRLLGFNMKEVQVGRAAHRVLHSSTMLGPRGPPVRIHA